MCGSKTNAFFLSIERMETLQTHPESPEGSSFKVISHNIFITHGWFNLFFFFGLLWLYWQVSLKIWQERGRGGVTRSKGTQAGSRTRVRCRASTLGRALYHLKYTAPPDSTFNQLIKNFKRSVLEGKKDFLFSIYRNICVWKLFGIDKRLGWCARAQITITDEITKKVHQLEALISRISNPTLFDWQAIS